MASHSFIHIEDAAAATALAVAHGKPGPLQRRGRRAGARARNGSPPWRTQVGAPRPMRVPRWIGRLLAGKAMATMLTEGRGASNGKAKRELNWEPPLRQLAPGVRGRTELMDERERLLEDLQAEAFAIAYRMLGSVAEAEDVVQEACCDTGRWRRARRSIPPGYLATVVTRLAIDELRSARSVGSATSAIGFPSRC